MTYKTTSYDQSEILHAINALHLSGEGIDLDPMYGKGGFYKQFPEPRFYSDILDGPQFDATDLSESQKVIQCTMGRGINSIILDPPFMHAQGKASAMKRYASYPSQKALRELYRALLCEAYRVLVPGGVLIFKNQDTVESGKQVWNHVWIHDRAVELGFEPVDLFVQLARSRITGHNHGRQVHARKHHAFWWVFRRRVGRQAKAPPTMTDADGNVWVQLPMEADSGA